MSNQKVYKSNPRSKINEISQPSDLIKASKEEIKNYININNSIDSKNSSISAKKSPSSISDRNSIEKNQVDSSKSSLKASNEAKKQIKIPKKSDKLKPGAKVASSKSGQGLKPSNNSTKKFQRNTEHTQSIKLIKENLANLFLTKKTTSPTSLNPIPNKIDQVCVSDKTEHNSSNVVQMSDLDILKVIEIETQKNQANKKEINSSETISRFSLLNNRLSARFSSSNKIKKTNAQPFNFLKLKPPIDNPLQTKLKEKNKTSSSQLNSNDQLPNVLTSEEFVDADQVLNSVEIQQPMNAVASRLSFPISNENSTNNRLSTKRFFNFIAGSTNPNKAPNVTYRHSNLIDQRRLSDYHRPLTVC